MADYHFTQQSGSGFKVNTDDKADSYSDTNEIRQILTDLGALLVHSKKDGSYPEDLTTGGALAIPYTAIAAMTSAQLAGIISNETGSGLLVFGTAPSITTIDLTGGQIAFPATAVPSAGVNVLDDYEEGTWTAVISGSGTAGTYEIFSQKSNYTKIGRIVHLETYIIMAASITGGGTDILLITGCPFTKMPDSLPVGLIITAGIDFTGTQLNASFTTSGTSSVLCIKEIVDDGASINLPISAIAASDVIYLSITFFTN